MINKSRGAALLAFALVLSLIPFSANSNSHGAGPQGPPCGIYKVKKDEVIAGVKFPKGSYQINAFGISCSKVLGSKGLFAKFLKLKDKDPLPNLGSIYLMLWEPQSFHRGQELDLEFNQFQRRCHPHHQLLL